VKKILQKILVPYEYPVVFTRSVFAPRNDDLLAAMDRLNEGRRHRVSVYVDAGAARSRRGLLRDIGTWFSARRKRLELAGPPRIVPGGEAVKSERRLLSLTRDLAAQKLCRHSFVVIVGGGAVLDAVGLAASLVHRGLRVVRVPTTALGQCDSGVGVKTAVNLAGAKNLIGTFAPPFAVINDEQFLETLPDREWSGAIAEAFKVAIIKSAPFFNELCRSAVRLKARDLRVLARVVRRCAELHLDHIRTGGDPFELGRARPLDFGHWAAHKLEMMSGFRISHGEAVAAGVALDSIYASLRGWITKPECGRVLRGLAESGCVLWYPELARRDRGGKLEILRGLEDFREHLGGELCVTYPRGIGRRHEVHEVRATLVAKAILRLKRTALSDSWKRGLRACRAVFVVDRDLRARSNVV